MVITLARFTKLIWAVSLCLAGLSLRGQAQTKDNAVSPPDLEDAAPIDVQADRLAYRDNMNKLVATGNVVITQGNSIFQSDEITYNVETGMIAGKGSSEIIHEGRTYQVSGFSYNTNTQEGDFQKMEIREGPWKVTAESTKRLGPDEFILHNSVITTCEGENPEFYIRAGSSRIVRGEEIYSEDVVVYLWGVPVFYLPYAKRDLQSEKTNIDVTPGYSSRMGGFLLTSYNYKLNESTGAATRLDYRSKRGVAFGQDVAWKDWDGHSYDGKLRAYYMPKDDHPFEDEADRRRTEDHVAEERYRLQLRDRRRITDSDTLHTRLDYLSDPDVLEDFFDWEFRYKTQPENFLTLTRREQLFSASVNVNQRLNDFYDNINRVPEITFDLPSLQLGESAFYLTSRNKAGFLQASFAEQGDEKDFESSRLDSANQIRHYSRHFDWLNVIPRVGYAVTHYSFGIEPLSINNPVSTANSVGGNVEEETVPFLPRDGGDRMRHVFELGFETSYKAFKTLSEAHRGNDVDVGMRHIVEPFANYTFVPKPNVDPEELYPFDNIDLRDEANDLVLGFRNKLQTKRRERVHDLLDINLFATINVDKADNEGDTIESISLDGEYRWFDQFWLDLDGRYDMSDGGAVTAFNTQVWLRWPTYNWGVLDGSRLSLEHRYMKDRRDLFSGTIRLFPHRDWSYVGYVRFNPQRSELEEHSHFFTRKFACLGAGFGYKEIDDDYTVWGQMWLLAFPRSIVGIGR